MRARLVLAIVAAASVAGIPLARAATPTEHQLAITETTDSFQLSLPVSRLVMTIPRGNFAVVRESGSGAADNPGYFHLEDRTRGIVISGWFVPAQAYGGIKQLWRSETDAWKKNRLPMPRNTSFVKVDKWDTVLYDIKVPGGSNTHIRGEWVDLGTWIDVHISATTTESIGVARATAMDVLKGLRITEAP